MPKRVRKFLIAWPVSMFFTRSVSSLVIAVYYSKGVALRVRNLLVNWLADVDNIHAGMISCSQEWLCVAVLNRRFEPLIAA